MNRRPLGQHFNLFYEDFEYRLHTELQRRILDKFWDPIDFKLRDPLGRQLGSIHANTFVQINRKMAR